jgi:signal transduction histidine kinase
LVAARLEIGKLEIATVPTTLRANVAQVVEGWDPGVISGVKVVGADTKALADPARVRQILRNLISNAIRYGGDNIEVRIDADHSGTFVEVRDDGPGLPVEQWETIFEPYERGHSEVSQPGSVGLGLTVSRGLAVLMNGSLTYRYENDISVFTLRLPSA